MVDAFDIDGLKKLRFLCSKSRGVANKKSPDEVNAPGNGIYKGVDTEGDY